MRRVLITAAAAGIGRAIAERFLSDGCQVHICDIDAEALHETLTALPGLGGTQTDIGQPAAVDALFETAIGAMGGIDVLVNNHGIPGPRGPVESIPYEAWERTIAVNLTGMFATIKNAVPFMKRQRNGVIVNISTTSAKTGLPNRSPYVAGKVGVLGLTKTLARELGPWNIRCNAVLPGFMDNSRAWQMLQNTAEDKGVSLEAMKAQLLQFVSLKTLIRPAEIADAVAFLAGNEARHISGQELSVCGNVEWEE